MQRWQVWNDNTTVSTGKQQQHSSYNMIPQPNRHDIRQLHMPPHVTDRNYIFWNPLSGKGAAVLAEGLSGAVASDLGKVRYLN